MNIVGGSLLFLTVVIGVCACFYEKLIREKEIETRKIAAYLICENGYERRIFAEEFFLGSGKNADVRIPFSAGKIAPLHVYFFKEGEYFCVQNIDKEKPIYIINVEGTSTLHVGEKKLLKNGNRIMIDGYSMIFRRGGCVHEK